MRGLLAAFTLVALGLPAGASATTASVGYQDLCAQDPACSKYSGSYGVYRVSLVDAEGSDDDVTISRVGKAVVFTSRAEPIIAGSGCLELPDGRVSCTNTAESSGMPVIQSGAGNDHVVVESDLGRYARIDLGPGDDTLRGGPGDDLMIGGAGDDVLDGRGGFDVVDYTERERGVVVDLRRGQGGELGEHDRLVHPEWVEGGQGPDRLTGSGRAERLSGFEGEDVLRGGGGRDELNGGDDADRITGGRGDDTIVTDYAPAEDYYDEETTPGDDIVHAGPGDDTVNDYGGGDNVFYGGRGDDELNGGFDRDRLVGGPGDDVLDGDASASDSEASGGIDALDGGNGDDRLYAQDGLREHLRCGRGRDRAATDRRDRTAGCERVDRPR